MASYDDAVGKRDSLLIAQHRAGDPAAFEALYQLHYHRLLRFVRHRVREQDMVEDVAQEAFARAYDKIDGLRDTTSFYPWLTMIAKRLIIDHYRLRGRMTVVADLDPGLSEAPEAVLLEQQQHMDLAEAMQRIRGRHREVLTLREHEGLTYEEIAERLGVPTTTVPPLLHRARLALRREYLAVTENERTASLIPAAFYFFIDAVRRLRDRAMQYTGYLPDAPTLTGSVALVAASMGAMLTLTPFVADVPPTVEPQSSTVPAESFHQTIAEPAPAQLGDATVGTGDTSDEPPLEVPQQSVFTFRRDHAEEARRRGREEPVHLDYGGVSIAGDPEHTGRKLRALLAGDDEWMEEQ